MSGLDVYLQDTWHQALSVIKQNEVVDTIIYTTYFDDTKLLSLTDKLATVVVFNVIQKEVLNSFIEILNDSLSEVTNREYSCQIVLQSDVSNLNNSFQISEDRQKQLFNKNAQDLNPDYIFESFIVGDSNKEPYSAALAASTSPGKFYNPLFIYGDSGLGKTHLLNSIGNYIQKKNPDAKILLITASDFVTGVFHSKNNLEDYKNKLSSVDVLLFDEVQFLADKKKSDEIFFHVFNELVNKRKQIVLTSDCPPHELKGLEDRLVSRFSSGLTVTINAPEFETAVRIIKSKLEKQTSGLDIDNNVIDYIAANYSSDVRKIEGALNRLIFNLIQNNDKEKIDLPFAISILKDVYSINSTLTPKIIKDAVKNFYGLSKGQLEGKSRTNNIAVARHIAMYLIRKHLDLPFKEIGDLFGKRDHSTVMNGCTKVENLIKTDKNYKTAITKIEDYFTNEN